jgi:ubiquinone/menaquinone biosynthesis C-methylase UbiE
MADSVSDRMRADWNQRARDDAHFYVAFGGRDQTEEEFLATSADVLRSIEGQLKRLPAKANRRAWRALEIGCGPGRLVKPLSRHFGEIHGVDVSDEMIRLARQRLADIPHAHFHTTDGASLPQFADASFDFIYSYAVFQHIPSRDVVFEYMREIRRLLKPGGVFHGQFNGVAPAGDADTWSGVSFSSDDIHAFTRENDLQLLNLEGEHTQYLWTTWLKPALTARQFASAGTNDRMPVIRRITNAYTGDSLIPQRGRHAAVSLWINDLPPSHDLNQLEILVDSVSGTPVYISPADPQGLQQVNAWLPDGVRTGLVPVELRVATPEGGQPLCPLAFARIVPAGPLVPRIVSITDGVDLVLKNATSSGVVKVQIEEVMSPDSVRATIDNQPVAHLDIFRTDPRPPRHNLDVELPRGLPPGPHALHIHVGPRRVLPAIIEVRPYGHASIE